MPRFVQLDFDDAVATLTLNRPDRLNAITRDLISDFQHAFAGHQPLAAAAAARRRR